MFLPIYLVVITVGMYSLHFSCFPNSVAAALTSAHTAREIWMKELILNNGLGAWLGWAGICCTNNLFILIVWNGLQKWVSGVVCLSLMFIGSSVWCFVEHVICDPYTQYIITPYIFYMIGLLAVRGKKKI